MYLLHSFSYNDPTKHQIYTSKAAIQRSQVTKQNKLAATFNTPIHFLFGKQNLKYSSPH